MPRVLIENYSNFYCTRTKVQFNPILDRRTGCYVGLADVTPEQAEAFANRGGFRLISDEEFLAMSGISLAPASAQPASGEPLQDAATAKKAEAARRRAEAAKKPASGDPPGPPVKAADNDQANPPQGETPAGEDEPPPPPESK